MLKLIFKFIGLFILIVLIGELGRKSMNLPYSWGNIQLSSKLEYIKEKKLDPSTYFIGSSVTYHGVIPNLFDNLTQKAQNSSFNLASDGTYPPQTLYIVENLLEQDTTIEYIFYELNTINHLPKHLFQTTRSKYYLEPKHLFFCIKYIWTSDYTKGTNLRNTHKLGLISRYCITYFESLFKMGMRKEVINSFNKKSKNELKKLINKDIDGYGKLVNRRYENKSSQMSLYLEDLERNYANTYRNIDKATFNPVFRNVLMEQLNTAKAKGVTIIYVFNAIKYSFENLGNMVALFHSLPKENRIDLANPSKNSELFKVENRWDEGHFNHKGATINTEKIVEVLKHLGPTKE